MDSISTCLKICYRDRYFTSVFNSNVRHQELLFTCGVFALLTFERFVVCMGQLVIEQVLLVIACVFAELAFKPDNMIKEYCWMSIMTRP